MCACACVLVYTYIHAYIPGEIYNHEELYEQLLAEGHAVTRHTKTDSEVFHLCDIYNIYHIEKVAIRAAAGGRPRGDSTHKD